MKNESESEASNSAEAKILHLLVSPDLTGSDPSKLCAHLRRVCALSKFPEVLAGSANDWSRICSFSGFQRKHGGMYRRLFHFSLLLVLLRDLRAIQ